MKRILAALTIICVVGFMCIQVLAEEEGTGASNLAEKWGAYQAEKTTNDLKQQNETTDLYAKGNKAVITKEEMEQATYFFELQGVDIETAEERAYEYMKESAALYVKALEEGEAVTDEEVKTYVEGLRALLKDESLDDISRKEIEGVITGFGDEEAYWEYQETVYKKMLVSQKLVDSLQDEYYSSGSGNSEGWEKYFQDYKNKLVENEQFEKLQGI